MAGIAKPKPLQAFEANMADAERLVAYARALTNKRSRRLRAELRERLAAALKFRIKDKDLLDGLESDDLFVVFKPTTTLSRADFADQAPLLRQALVAGCAAAETFFSDWATERVRALIRERGELPSRLNRVPMTVADWQLVQAKKYPRRAITDYVISPFIREHASTAPSKVGELLSLVGYDKPLARIDSLRKVTVGTTEEELTRITERRNRIAHASDWVGRRRASITVDEVETMLADLRSIVHAVNRLPALRSSS